MFGVEVQWTFIPSILYWSYTCTHIYCTGIILHSKNTSHTRTCMHIYAHTHTHVHTHTHTHTHIDCLLGLTALGGAVMLGGVVAVGVAALAGMGIAKLSKRHGRSKQSGWSGFGRTSFHGHSKFKKVKKFMYDRPTGSISELRYKSFTDVHTSREIHIQSCKSTSFSLSSY